MPIVRLDIEKRNKNTLASVSIDGKSSRVFQDESAGSALDAALEWAIEKVGARQTINAAWDERMLISRGETEDEDEWADDNEIAKRIKETPYLHVKRRPLSAKWSKTGDVKKPLDGQSRFKLAIKKIISSGDDAIIMMAAAALEDILDE